MVTDLLMMTFGRSCAHTPSRLSAFVKMSLCEDLKKLFSSSLDNSWIYLCASKPAPDNVCLDASSPL